LYLGANAATGLISQYAKLTTDQNPTATCYPTFFCNDYLKLATVHYQYYLGIEIAGFDLLIEYAHSISGTAPITAEARIVQAIKDFNLHFDAEMKLIAANNHVTVGGKNYYPSLVLPSDQLIYYGRSGRFWLRTNACAPDQTNTQKSPCLFTTPTSP
jgi:hypothetical protein